MGAKYRHLSKSERDRISFWKGQGLSLRQMAKRLGRSPATLSRELRRNSAPLYRNAYLAHRAQGRAEERWRSHHRKLRLKSPSLRQYVRQQLQAGWSPELIAGRLSGQTRRQRISHEAIYQWIYAEARELISTLARSHRRRLRRGYSRKHRKAHIHGRISIQQRPAHIATRRQVGHWEVDTAVSSKGKAALAVMVERKSRLAKVRRLRGRTARSLRVALNRSMAQYPKHLRRSFTYDNGTENVEHLQVNRCLGSRSYFCQPMKSWQKGTVENRIGLIRRRYPKGTDFARLTVREIKQLESSLNRRPCKCLGFKTPAEAFRLERCT
jgi:IS30 family transposase